MFKAQWAPHARRISSFDGTSPTAQTIVTEEKMPVALLAEDSEDDAYFFMRTVRRSGCQCSVQRVANGGAAINFLNEARAETERLPQIIFLDLKMPLVNGFEVLDWMRAHGLLTQIPVVVLSGSERLEDKDRAAEYGAREYLVKPLKVAELSRILAEFCPASENPPVEKVAGGA